MINIENGAEFLYKNGLLWYINKQILHDYGLALVIMVNDKDEGIKNSICLYKTLDHEPITFSHDDNVIGAKKLAKWSIKQMKIVMKPKKKVDKKKVK